MMTVSEGVAVMTQTERFKEIPYLVCLKLAGAIVHDKYKGKDAKCLVIDGQEYPVSDIDFKIVEVIADEVAKELELPRVLSARYMMCAHRLALMKMEKYLPAKAPVKKIAMLKDTSGSGYWRMVLPAKHMDGNDVSIDVTSAEMKFESLLEYDTVFVQRLHDWESYYILEKLKKAGRKVVYDMDDDIFSLTPDNPAFHVIGRDNQMAARECMKLADVVTTTTDLLGERLKRVCDGEVEPVTMPNAVSMDGWIPTDLVGSPDEWKRIFWQGSATHEEDWELCIVALDEIMKSRDDVRMVILGYLPKSVQALSSMPHWKGRIEYMGFSDTETYFQIVKHLRAEVGLAPLQNTVFNQAKSSIKWMENALIGMPTVASACSPYAEVIEDNVSGRIVVPGVDSWREAIESYLDNKPLRIETVRAAREEIGEQFNIAKVAEDWRTILW